MKCKILILAIASTFFGCENPNVSRKSTEFIFSENGSRVEFVEIDSCEYLYVPNGNASWGSHKGNCRFCKTRNIK